MKIDLFKDHAAEYAATAKPVVLEVKPAQYLAIRGSGDPGGPAFQSAIATLFGVAFAIKMASKIAGRDYAVAKFEGLYQDREHRTLLIRAPDFIGAKQLRDAIASLRSKGNDAAYGVTLQKLKEGKSVQVLRAGPYAGSPKTIDRLWAFCRENGLKIRELIHEIYLNDPRRTAPARLRTVVRQPVA
jgi:hypothetical protein